MWIRAFFTLSQSMHDNSVHHESLLQVPDKILLKIILLGIHQMLLNLLSLIKM